VPSITANSELPTFKRASRVRTQPHVPGGGQLAGMAPMKRASRPVVASKPAAAADEEEDDGIEAIEL
jgi:hypothetical protein